MCRNWKIGYPVSFKIFTVTSDFGYANVKYFKFDVMGKPKKLGWWNSSESYVILNNVSMSYLNYIPHEIYKFNKSMMIKAWQNKTKF